MSKATKTKAKPATKDDRKHVIFRVDDETHDLLKIAAVAEGTSMDAYVNRIILPSLEPYRAIQSTFRQRRKVAAS